LEPEGDKMKKLILVAGLLLGGCMETTEQMAAQVQADVDACKKVKLPQRECLAALAEKRRERDAELWGSSSRSTMTCSTLGGVTSCY